MNWDMISECKHKWNILWGAGLWMVKLKSGKRIQCNTFECEKCGYTAKRYYTGKRWQTYQP